jgi:hypothetical protein
MTKSDRLVALLALTLAAACGSSGSASPLEDGGGSGGSSSGGGSDDGTTGTSSSGSSGSSGDDGGSSGNPGSSGSSGSPSSSGTSSDGGASSSSSGASSGASGGDASSTYDFSVYQHHKNPTRDGVFTEPTFTKTAVTTMHATTFMGTVTTAVYAQPLYVEDGPGGNPVYIIGTEQNHLTVFNASTGMIVWDDGPTSGPTVIGQPVTGGLPCGNITPLGITGTPYIDTSSGQAIIYFDAMTTPDNNTTAKHMVYAVKLADGTSLPNWPVDINAKITNFTSKTQNERGALQLLNGTLYVPYGGLWGDCGTYYGWVVGIPVATPQSPVGWRTSTTQAGIWASGSLPTDGTSLFPVTGNSSATTTTSAWAGSEAVIRLAAGPTFSGATADYFTPTDWKSLDGPADNDLGGASAVVFDIPGAAHPHLLAQGGKDGNFYLMDRDNLGGVGGELVQLHIATGNLKGGPAVYTTSMATYVAYYTTGGGVSCPNTGGSGNLVVVKVTAGATPTAAVAWCASKANLGSPMVTTTDGTSNAIVWDANTTLWGFDGDTGAVLAGGTNTSLVSGLQSFNSAISAHGKIVVGVNGALQAFSP